MTEDEKKAAEARDIWDEMLKPRSLVEQRLLVAEFGLPGQPLMNPAQFQSAVEAAMTVDAVVEAAAALRARRFATKRFVETARTRKHFGLDTIPDAELPPLRPRD